MSWREWLDWLVFVRDTPLPQERTDWLLGSILAAILNQGALSRVQRHVGIADVVPWLKPKPARAAASTKAGTRAAIQADMDHWTSSFRATGVKPHE